MPAAHIAPPELDALLQSARSEGPLQAVLDWLARPASSDPAHEAPLLAGCLALFAQAELEAQARVRVLDIFHDRALSCAITLKPELAASALPVPDALRAAADHLAGVLMQVARGYLEK